MYKYMPVRKVSVPFEDTYSSFFLNVGSTYALFLHLQSDLNALTRTDR